MRSSARRLGWLHSTESGSTCGWRIGKNLRVVRCARRPEPESSAKTAFVRCTIEAVPSVSQGGRAIGVERWRVLSNQIFSRFRRQAAIGV